MIEANKNSSGTEAKREQSFLNKVYSRVDDLRLQALNRRKEILREVSENPQELSERDSYEKLYNDDLAKLSSAENNLYFGKVTTPEETIRIGKIGILDNDENISTLLTDWRAPLARPFYISTPANPGEVLTKSHINTRNRKITSVQTSNLKLTPDAEVQENSDITDENYLIEVLNSARTGKMQEIVTTIQAEQDDIIRSNYKGVTVVQGGPGTGKTAVALHRIAYLMYTYRQQLSRSGVLIIGPNNTFIDYIDQVLPDLGETGVVLKTIGSLYPGVNTAIRDNHRNIKLKGSLEIIVFLKAAIKQLLRNKIAFKPILVEGIKLKLTPEILKKAKNKTNLNKRTYLENRKIFLKSLANDLLHQYEKYATLADQENKSLLVNDDLQEVFNEITENEEFTAQTTKLWPEYTPITLLTKIFSNKSLLKQLSKESKTDYLPLFRTEENPFTISDIPLLDELADLLGITEVEKNKKEEKTDWKQALADAQQALDVLASSAPQDLEDDTDPEILMAYDLLNAEKLASRQINTASSSTAEKAEQDRLWTYGHVVVDEAQELTPMEWHILFKKIPSKWMTVVGDVNQTNNPLGSTSWQETFYPYVKNRLNYQELTVNYRTPREIMDSITPLIEQINPQTTIPIAIRSNGKYPKLLRLTKNADLVHNLEYIFKQIPSERTFALIVSDNSYPDLINNYPQLAEKIYRISDTKGLEFDVVTLLNPTSLVNEHRLGKQDLLVATTRATQELLILSNESKTELNKLFTNLELVDFANYRY